MISVNKSVEDNSTMLVNKLGSAHCAFLFAIKPKVSRCWFYAGSSTNGYVDQFYGGGLE